MPTPKIAIIGAGPAGLTLARLLHVSQVKVDLTLYELDASPTSRPDRGGTLDLHTDTGLVAIRKCGLWDAFRKYARYDGEELVIVDKNATEFIHLRGGENGGILDRPEIDREQLKKILLESVPDEYVRWDWHLREVTEDGLLRFDDREKLEGPFDLIVGGDGAWSKMRARLNELKPAYAGVSGYEMDIKDPPNTCPHVDKMVGRGSYFACSDQKYLNAQRMWDNGIKVRDWYVCPEGDAKEQLNKHGKGGDTQEVPGHARRLGAGDDGVPEAGRSIRLKALDTLRAAHRLQVGASQGLHADRGRREPRDAVCGRGRQLGHEGRARVGGAYREEPGSKQRPHAGSGRLALRAADVSAGGEGSTADHE